MRAESFCVQAAVQMSDDVEARFRSSPRVVSTKTHPVSFGMVHTCLCERDQPIRCSLKFEVCVLGRISAVFVVKNGYHRAMLFLPVRKILRASQPREQVQVLELMRGRTIHCERQSTCRDFHRNSGYGTPSTSRLARSTSGSSARDRPAQKPSGMFCPKNDCHALHVLALQSVVPRVAVCLHSLFNEECLYRDLHVFRRSSQNVCSSGSMAVGGELDRSSALPRFARVLRERAAVFLVTRCSA